eukprot:1276661-Amphidinium_carterae.1
MTGQHCQDTRAKVVCRSLGRAMCGSERYDSKARFASYRLREHFRLPVLLHLCKLGSDELRCEGGTKLHASGDDHLRAQCAVKFQCVDESVQRFASTSASVRIHACSAAALQEMATYCVRVTGESRMWLQGVWCCGMRACMPSPYIHSEFPCTELTAPPIYAGVAPPVLALSCVLACAFRPKARRRENKRQRSKRVCTAGQSSRGRDTSLNLKPVDEEQAPREPPLLKPQTLTHAILAMVGPPHVLPSGSNRLVDVQVANSLRCATDQPFSCACVSFACLAEVTTTTQYQQPQYYSPPPQ